MKINIYVIAKKSNDEFDKIYNKFLLMSSKYAKVEIQYIFNKNISKAQNISKFEAKKSYSNAYEKFLTGYNIALDIKGKQLDSLSFPKLIENKNEINFFVGGAYGLEDSFLAKCDIKISLGDITMAHKVAMIVLSEQIFRALSINNHHPYHKI